MNKCGSAALDWFHITMRLTVMLQMAKGLGGNGSESREIAFKELERIKWFLWHGNLFRALETVDDLFMDLDKENPTEKRDNIAQKAGRI